MIIYLQFKDKMFTTAFEYSNKEEAERITTVINTYVLGHFGFDIGENSLINRFVIPANFVPTTDSDGQYDVLPLIQFTEEDFDRKIIPYQLKEGTFTSGKLILPQELAIATIRMLVEHNPDLLLAKIGRDEEVVSQPFNFGGKSKDYIYELTKKCVKNEFESNPGLSPDEPVNFNEYIARPKLEKMSLVQLIYACGANDFESNDIKVTIDIINEYKAKLAEASQGLVDSDIRKFAYQVDMDRLDDTVEILTAKKKAFNGYNNLLDKEITERMEANDNKNDLIRAIVSEIEKLEDESSGFDTVLPKSESKEDLEQANSKQAQILRAGFHLGRMKQYNVILSNMISTQRRNDTTQ